MSNLHQATPSLGISLIAFGIYLVGEQVDKKVTAPSLSHQSHHQHSVAPSYHWISSVLVHLGEIWQHPVHRSGDMSESGGGLGLRGANFGQILSQFGTNREVSGELGAKNGARKLRNVEDESAKLVSTSNGDDDGNGNGVNDSDGKRIKTSGSRDDNNNSKGEAELCPGKPAEQNSQPPEPPKQDYIHVRARRAKLLIATV